MGVCLDLGYPVETRRKFNVHKTFRRSPGRLLNVLWTFNLRPVSNAYASVTLLKDPIKTVTKPQSENNIQEINQVKTNAIQGTNRKINHAKRG